MGLIVALWGIYAQCAGHDFVFFDDASYIADNPIVNRGISWDGFVAALTTAHSANWHPVTWWAHALDVQFFGLSAGAHALSNAALHAGTAIALLFLIRRLTGSLGVAALVAFVFAVHPANVENVAWISEKKSLLSALFGFLALSAYLKSADRHRPGPCWPALGWYALSLAAKPMLVTLPLLLLLLDWIRWQHGTPAASARSAAGSAAAQNVQSAQSPDGPSASDGPTPPPAENRSAHSCSQLHDHGSAPREPIGWRSRLLGKLPFALLAAGSCVITSLVQYHAGAMGDLDRINWPARLSNVVYSYWRYLDKFLLPRDHAVLYPFPSHYSPVWVGLGLLGLVGATLLLLRWAGKVPWLTFGWLWYVISLLPVIGLVQVGSQSLADRYLYIPMFGLLVGGIATLRALQKPPIVGRLLQLLAVGWVASLAVAAWAQASYWTNSETLFRQSLANTKGNFLQHGALGLYFHKQGRLNEAETEFRAGLSIRPDNAGLLTNLGVTLNDLGRTHEAITCLESAVRAAPNNAEWHYNLAVIYVRAAQLEKGIAECHVMLKLNAADERARQLLAAAKALQPTAARVEQPAETGPGTP